jgi:hypothetical protein
MEQGIPGNPVLVEWCEALTTVCVRKMDTPQGCHPCSDEERGRERPGFVGSIHHGEGLGLILRKLSYLVTSLSL